MKNIIGEEVTIEELAMDVEMLIGLNEVSYFNVTEKFVKNGEKTYNVMGLTVQIEDGFVVCGDADDIIIQNQHVLMMFLKSNVIHAYRVVTDTDKYGKLYFNDGTIIVRAVAS